MKERAYLGRRVAGKGEGVEGKDGGIMVIKNQEFEKAKLVIEYRPEIKEGFMSIKNYPEQFKIRFLEILENNPQIGIKTLLNKVNDECREWNYPYDNGKLNKSILIARQYGKEAEEEFVKIVEMLGDSVDVENIIKKIKEKYKKVQKQQNNSENT